MVKKSEETPTQGGASPPRIIADFGGRRRLLDRRLTQSDAEHDERRSGKERRCGFDRRSALNQSIEVDPDMRQSSGNPNHKDHEP